MMSCLIIVTCGALVCALPTTADDASQEKEAELISVTRIWDQAPHNAFTGLVYHQGKRI